MKEIEEDFIPHASQKHSGHRGDSGNKQPQGVHQETPTNEHAHATESAHEPKVLSAKEIASGYTSPIAFEDVHADCLAIICSDQRFREQQIGFLHKLGYKYPSVIQLPGGIATVHPMIAAINFLSKAVDHMILKIVELTDVREIICIAHEDCGGYQTGGKHDIIGKISRRLADKSVPQIQQEHLEKAGRSIARTIHGVHVRAFYAHIVDDAGKTVVRFKEVPLNRQTRIEVL